MASKRGFREEEEEEEAPRIVTSIVFCSGDASNAEPPAADRKYVRIVWYDGALYCWLDDLVDAIGCHWRSAVANKTLNKMGAQGKEWDWLYMDTTSRWERFIRMDQVTRYAEVLREGSLVPAGMVTTVDSWAAGFWNHYNPGEEPAVAGMRVIRTVEVEELPPIQVPPPLPRSLVDEMRAEDSGGDEEDDKVADGDFVPEEEEEEDDEEEAAPMDVEEEEEEEEEPLAPGQVAMTYAQRQEVITAHTRITKSVAINIQLMPKDDPEYQHAQCQLHNSMVLLRLLGPTMCDFGTVVVDMPRLPAVGQPTVRLSDRMRALGHDPTTVPEERRVRIALDAAARYRRSRFAGPFKISVWAGTRLVQRYHYTEETQHFLDEAIRAEMARDEGEDARPRFRVERTWKKQRVARYVSILQEEEEEEEEEDGQPHPQPPTPMLTKK